MVKHLWDNFFRKEDLNSLVSKLLSETYLFESLTSSELRFLRGIVHVRNYKPGEHVFQQGQLGVGLYVILKGAIDISVESSDHENGERGSAVLTRLKQGDFFGEISLVEENSRRTATATAAAETTLVGFFKPDLEEVIARSPLTGIKIITRLSEVLGRRLRETADKITELKKEIRKMNPSP